MSAEEIAGVVADITSHRVNVLDPSEHGKRLALFASNMVKSPVVVDATLIYESLAENPKPIFMYEDHPCITPPWPEMAVCYRNEHGNVVVMHVTTEEFKGGTPPWDPDKPDPIEWERVKWISHVFVYVGGKGRSFSTNVVSSFPTTGPMHLWRFAIYEDGEPADLSWVQIDPNYPMEKWDMAHLVVLGSLNFLNCSNVELVEPQRPRAEARRIERTGIKVSVINVFGLSKRSEANSKGQGGGIALSSVRGHFATYGPEYGKGLLFGKLSGRFWVPQHARGERDKGETEQSFRLIP